MNVNGGDAYLFSITEDTDISSDGTNKGRVIDHKGRSGVRDGRVKVRFTVTEDFPNDVEVSQFQVITGPLVPDQVIENSPQFPHNGLKAGFTWEYVVKLGDMDRSIVLAVNNIGGPIASGKLKADVMPILP